MDRNQVIGLVLISFILIVYLQFFAPEPVSNPPQKNPIANTKDTSQQQTPILSAAKDDSSATLNDSLIEIQRNSQFGIFSALVDGQVNYTEFENDVFKIKFSSKGGNPVEMELKDYKTHQKKPLILFDENSLSNDLLVETKDGKKINISELNFKTSSSSQKIEKDSITISFVAEIVPQKSISKTYTIYKNSYKIAHNIKFNNLNEELKNDFLTLKLYDKQKRFEKDIQDARYKSTINYMLTNEDFDYLTERSSGIESENIDSVRWISLKQKFFIKSWIGVEAFPSAKIQSSIDSKDSTTEKHLTAEIKLNYSALTSDKTNFILYFGPNKHSVLSDLGYDMEQNVSLGWAIFRWVNRWLVIPLFEVLEGSIASYGIIIFILVLVVKIILFPLSYKSYASMAKMRVLKPELDALKEKLGNDMTKMQQEQMKIYQKFGVNPLSGCIPVLLQMPVLLALFNFFPHAIELRQESFLWADDLSTYDAVITWQGEIPIISWAFGNHLSLFTLLMTISTLAYTYLNNQLTPMTTQPGQPNMKVISYLMPVIFLFVLNSYSSGLTYYYFLSNIVTIGQQFLIKAFVDEEEIRRKMEEYSKKADSGKKSSFSKRLENAMKAQQEKSKKK